MRKKGNTKNILKKLNKTIDFLKNIIYNYIVNKKRSQKVIKKNI